jgi:hypothetical protein
MRVRLIAEAETPFLYLGSDRAVHPVQSRAEQMWRAGVAGGGEEIRLTSTVILPSYKGLGGAGFWRAPRDKHKARLAERCTER